jgi:aminoglycoside phosphotransferase (APT) family kinase protein
VTGPDESLVALEPLTTWMDALDLPGAGLPVEMSALDGGSQNVIVEVRRGDHRYVLRRPPLNAPPGRSEALMRECRILSALRHTDVPHARLHGVCADPAVLGDVFYLMEFVPGWSPADEAGWLAPFDADVPARHDVGIQVVDGIARLARVDYVAHGLADFGRPDGFHDRQVDRWLAHLERYKFREIAGLDVSASWLRRTKPASWVPGVMHGDYQFANLRFAPGGSDLAAIVDWEMCTIGDPLLDLAWVLMLWRDPGEGEDTVLHIDYQGLPSRSELVEHYAAVSGRSVEDLQYYQVLAHFKMAIVLEGGNATYVRGDAWSERLATFGAVVDELAARAADLTLNASAR